MRKAVRVSKFEAKTRLRCERLEDRSLLSATPGVIYYSPPGVMTPYGGSASAQGLSPAKVRSAYGIDQISFGSVIGDGTGQTIAIIDAYDNPKFVSSTSSTFSSSDLAKFDANYVIPDPPSFIKVGQTGSQTSLPAGNTGWGGEIALDQDAIPDRVAPPHAQPDRAIKPAPAFLVPQS